MVTKSFEGAASSEPRCACGSNDGCGSGRPTVWSCPIHSLITPQEWRKHGKYAIEIRDMTYIQFDDERSMNLLFDAHNAALAAEREESERVAQTLYCNIKESQQELASEQQRWADQSNRLYKMIQDRDKELAAEREQREKESRHLRNYINDLQWKLADEREKSDRLDGALHHPDDENHTCLFKSRLLAVQAANKPLVEALEWYVMNSLTPQRAKAALATAKDGKHTEWWRLPDSEGRPRDRK